MSASDDRCAPCSSTPCAVAEVMAQATGTRFFEVLYRFSSSQFVICSNRNSRVLPP